MKILTLPNLFSFKTRVKPTLFEFPIRTEFAKLEVKYIFPSSFKSVRGAQKGYSNQTPSLAAQRELYYFLKDQASREIEQKTWFLNPSPWPISAILHLASEPIKTHSLSLQMWQIRTGTSLSLFFLYFNVQLQWSLIYITRWKLMAPFTFLFWGVGVLRCHFW